ncbi:MAG: hypothetical protein IT442_11900, partial [Phycisphaeraceae bacterium]|nr:hypothetical protein [Phycisphaeraceae bacterium]
MSAPHAGRIDPAAVRRHRRWDDAPLRLKLGLLVALSSSGGALVGAWVVKLHDPGWFLSVGLTTIVCLVLWLGFRWMVWPVESL